MVVGKILLTALRSLFRSFAVVPTCEDFAFLCFINYTLRTIGKINRSKAVSEPLT